MEQSLFPALLWGAIAFLIPIAQVSIVMAAMGAGVRSRKNTNKVSAVESGATSANGFSYCLK